MQRYLSESAYKAIREAIEWGKAPEPELAEQLAAAMKTWALDKGAHHYTLWMHPTAGKTAEKYQTFFRSKDGKMLEQFKGEELIKRIPGVGTLPSGSARSTFEGRGLKAWDVTSPPFIMEIGEMKTLCIPTVFTDYSGQAFDDKTPLLRSQEYLNKAAVAVGQYFDRNINKVKPVLGCEQEFYVVDESVYQERPDLKAVQRTLFGKPCYKNRLSTENYFGAIPAHIQNFLSEVEQKAHELGISLHTRHNEMGHGQYEIVPSFEVANLAVDHNQLLTDILQNIAQKHGLRVLLHEKPFKGMSGSARHNNWSLYTNTGKNLLAPAETPRKNILFLTFLVNTLNAINSHAPLLYASLMSAGNEHRLGADGAPPAMIAVYIGQQLESVLNDIEKLGDEWLDSEEKKQALKQDIHSKIPSLLMGNTDMNRTAPLAYTGDKLEIRLAGASQNTAATMTVLNTIVADQLIQFKKTVEELIEKKKLKKDAALLKALRQLVKTAKPVILQHEKVTTDWEAEVNKRVKGFSQNIPEALNTYLDSTAKTVLKPVLNEGEIILRREVRLQDYISQHLLEAQILVDVCHQYFIPAGVRHQNQVLKNIRQFKDIGASAIHYKAQTDIATRSTSFVNDIYAKIEEIQSIVKQIQAQDDLEKKAIACYTELHLQLDQLQELIDKLESISDHTSWPFSG